MLNVGVITEVTVRVQVEPVVFELKVKDGPVPVDMSMTVPFSERAFWCMYLYEKNPARASTTTMMMTLRELFSGLFQKLILPISLYCSLTEGEGF